MRHTFFLTSLASTALSVSAYEKPNIILIVADDMGYSDVSFKGSPIKTPTLDMLAEEGVVLDRFQACPVSSPTRAGTMTGRYPIRFGMMRAVIAPQRDFGVDTTEVLIPQMLEDAGYKHRACFGKWHIGHNRQQWLPHNRGFNHYVGNYNGAVDYFTKLRNNEVDWHLNDQPLNEEGYVTDLIGKHASEYIASRPKDEPYFVYVPFTAPHSPLQAKEEDIEKYEGVKGVNKTYAAMVDCMDQNIAKIIDAARQRGDLDNTLIIFFSDNGGDKFSNNQPLRGRKFTTYEGGVRTLALAYWEKGDVTGGRHISDRMGYIDIFPTLKAAAYGRKHNRVDDKNKLDGMNVLPILKGKKDDQANERFWFSYIDQNTERMEYFAIHQGDYKLRLTRPAKDNTRKSELKTTIELYKLNEEKTDEFEPIQDKEIEAKLQTELNKFIDLKQDKQIDRYNVPVKGFKAPKSWVITKKQCLF